MKEHVIKRWSLKRLAYKHWYITLTIVALLVGLLVHINNDCLRNNHPNIYCSAVGLNRALDDLEQANYDANLTEAAQPTLTPTSKAQDGK